MYNTTPKPQDGDNALEVAEPLTADYNVRRTAVGERVEDWEIELEKRFTGTIRRDANVHEFLRPVTAEELHRSLENSLQDIRAGRVYPIDDVFRELDEEFGEFDEVLPFETV